MLRTGLFITVASFFVSSSLGLSSNVPSLPLQTLTVVAAAAGDQFNSQRRSLIVIALVSSSLLAMPLAARAESVDVRGTPITPFNSLMFQYRGSDFNGLDESTIEGPSISYAEFMTKLNAGEIERVEFQAPDGDKAYCFVKGSSSSDQQPIRIGSGYPVEQHDGYSSPLFAIRAVQNAHVPYKFVVPALAKAAH